MRRNILVPFSLVVDRYDPDGVSRTENEVFRRSLAVVAWTMLVIAFFASFWAWWTGDVISACPAIGKSC